MQEIAVVGLWAKGRALWVKSVVYDTRSQHGRTCTMHAHLLSVIPRTLLHGTPWGYRYHA